MHMFTICSVTYIINYQHVSIAFTIIIRVAIQECQEYNKLPDCTSGTTQRYNRCFRLSVWSRNVSLYVIVITRENWLSKTNKTACILTYLLTYLFTYAVTYLLTYAITQLRTYLLLSLRTYLLTYFSMQHSPS